MFLEVPIIGSGSMRDSYAPKLPGIADYAAFIPTDKKGAPKKNTCLVLVADGILKPTDATTIKDMDAIDKILLDDPTARPDKMKTRGATQVSRRQIDLVLGIAPALVATGLHRPISRRTLFVGGAMVMGGMLFGLPRRAEAARTTSSTETFTRSDNTDIGTAWDVQTGYTRLDLVSNAVQASALAIDCLEIYNAVSLQADQWISGVIKAITGAVGLETIVCGRSAGPSTDTHYLFQARRNFGVNTSKIQKDVTGAYTQLAVDTTQTWGAADTVEGEMVGTGLTLFRNSSSIFSTTDSAISSGASCGLHMYTDTGGTLSNNSFDGMICGGFSNPAGTQMLLGVG